MFSRFANPTRRACNLAGTEAIALNAPVIDTEHLLLGLVAHLDLQADGWKLDELRQAIRQLPPGEDPGPTLSYSLQAVEVLRVAGQTAAGEPVGLQHLAAALAQVPETRALLVLERCGLDLAVLQQRVEQELEPGSPSETAAPVALVNLCHAAAAGELLPAVGRSGELRQVMEALVRWNKSAPVLVGEPGVGKTAVVEALAGRLASGDVPAALRGCEIVAVNVSALMAGTRYRGDLEKRVEELLQYFQEHPELILFIDELHSVLGTGGSEGALDVAGMLKPALARGRLRMIGATTADEYARYIEQDPAFERRLQPIQVEEPSAAEALSMVGAVAERLETHHGLQITPEARAAAVRLSHRHLPDRRLPDKAVDLLDQACAACALDQCLEVAPSAVAAVLARWSGLDPQDLLHEQAASLADLEARIAARMIGQKAAVSAVARALRRQRAGLGDTGRPVGSFLFAGPTGVGKTQLARALASEVFDDERCLLRLDMSEYAERHDLSRLTGSAPGYVGYREGGLLVEALRRRPRQVVVFDEIEKAHPDVRQVLLQILEEGQLRDGRGRCADFSQALVILTSNVGSQWSARSKTALGFTTQDAGEQRRERIEGELRRAFAPELLGRLDEIVSFAPLTGDELTAVAQLQLDAVVERLRARDITLRYTQTVPRWLSAQLPDRELGARPLRRLLQREVEDRIARQLAEQDTRQLRLTIKDGQPVVSSVRSKR